MLLVQHRDIIHRYSAGQALNTRTFLDQAQAVGRGIGAVTEGTGIGVFRTGSGIDGEHSCASRGGACFTGDSGCHLCLPGIDVAVSIAVQTTNVGVCRIHS